MAWSSRRCSTFFCLLLLPLACADDDSSATTGSSSTSTTGTPPPTVTSVSAGSTSGSTSGSTTGGSGSTTTTVGDETATNTSTGEPVDCTPFSDERGRQPRDIVITNASDEPVFVAGAAECVPQFLIIDPVGGQGRYPNPDGCELTCEQLFAGACECPPVCSSVLPIVMTPGAMLTLPWSGVVFTEGNMPPIACYPDELPCASEACNLGVSAEGSYEVAVRWGPVSAFPDPACACVPDGDGLCEATMTDCGLGAPFTVNATFDHPDATPIELML